VSTLRFFDTNILLYSVSTHPADTAKRERALTILAEADGALSVQVLQEFYVQATRATRSDRLLHADAVDLITGWTRFPVQELTLTILNAALEITAAHRLSYWDSAIIAAAHALGCRELYTEDMNDGQRIAGVLIVNPFR
jgi:predicted nucleic acid-binding protein